MSSTARFPGLGRELSVASLCAMICALYRGQQQGLLCSSWLVVTSGSRLESFGEASTNPENGANWPFLDAIGPVENGLFIGDLTGFSVLLHLATAIPKETQEDASGRFVDDQRSGGTLAGFALDCFGLAVARQAPPCEGGRAHAHKEDRFGGFPSPEQRFPTHRARVTPVSHKASHYVKHLVEAPDGSKITATEKAVLCQLADDHREESGVAFPSIRTLARRSCVSERNCRRVIARLERKGILCRIATRRKDTGSQSSNFYVFRALDPPEVAKQLVESGRDSLKVPRILMAGGGGHHAPGPPDTQRRGTRTPPARTPGHPAPPIEHLREHSLEQALETQIELNTPISPSQASGEPCPIAASTAPMELARIGFGAATNAMHDALMRLTPPAFEKREGFRNGLVEWREYCFGDLVLESCEDDRSNGLVLTLSSPNPVATLTGFEKYKNRWSKALRQAFGRSAQLRVLDKRRENDQPDNSAKVDSVTLRNVNGEIAKVASLLKMP